MTDVLHAGSVQRGTVLQLLCCHCLIVLVAIISGFQSLALLLACGASFLLLLNIPYNLHVLEIMLGRLSRNQPVHAVVVRRRWPLTRLFVLARSLDERSEERELLEQHTIAYREQLLQQVGKTAAQEERNRLARDLHDSIKQQLFSIVVSAAAVKARWEQHPVSARKVVDDIERTAREAQVEMQALLQQLRPAALENVGLIESLRMQCQALHYRTGAEVVVELDNLPSDEQFPVGAQETIFRIVQEGFANIARHARAQHVWLSLWQQRDALLVEIGDDGQGFNVSQTDEPPRQYGGMGLSNVRERVEALGGTTSIWSSAGKGTTLNLCIPLAKSQVLMQAQVEQELPAVVGNTRRVLSAGTRVGELAAALIVLFAPAWLAFWFVLSCILLTAAIWLWAQQYRLQVSLEPGTKHSQGYELRAQSYALLAGIALLGMFCLNYLNTLQKIQRGSFIVGGLQQWPLLNVTLNSLLALVIIFTYVLSLSSMHTYYKSLSLKKRQEQVWQQGRQVVVDWLAWGGAVLLVTGLYTLFADALDTSVKLNAGLLLLVWGVLNLVKTLRLVYWQSMLYQRLEQITGGRVEGLL